MPVPNAGNADRLAAAGVGPQCLAQPPGVGRNQSRCGAKNMRGRAVILFQADHLGAGEVGLEFQDVANFGAAPAIDRLVVIADAADVMGGLCQQPQPQILCQVGVLVFVDQDIAEAGMITRQHVRVLLEYFQVIQQQIAEIAGVQHLQPRLILAVQRLALTVGIGMGLARRHPVGGQRLVLPTVNQAGQQARRPALDVNIPGLHQLFQQPHLIVGIKDGVVGFQPHQLGVIAQYARRHRMEGADGHAFHRPADEPRHAVLHLL